MNRLQAREKARGRTAKWLVWVLALTLAAFALPATDAWAANVTLSGTYAAVSGGGTFSGATGDSISDALSHSAIVDPADIARLVVVTGDGYALVPADFTAIREMSTNKYLTEIDLSGAALTGNALPVGALNNTGGSVGGYEGANGKLGNLTNVRLPASVTSIGNNAFSTCENLALTSLPANVTDIGKYAFNGCKNLALASLPANVTVIQEGAFSGCASLALASLPTNVTDIGAYAFAGGKNLALTSLPDDVTSIGRNAFAGCENLALMSLPDGVTSIGEGAFYNCGGLQTVLFMGDVPNSFEQDPFKDCGNLTQILVPDGAEDDYKAELPDQANIIVPFAAATSLTGGEARSVEVGNTISLGVTAVPAGVRITWVSSEPAIATVAPVSPGALTATARGVAAGTATVAAYAFKGDGSVLSTAFDVTVKTSSGPGPGPGPGPSPISVTGVAMSKTALDLETGDSGQLAATVTPSNASNKKVTWTSSDPNVVSVDQTGRVTALAPGTATITATTADGKKTATCTITVTGAPAPGPQERALFTINVADCEIVITQNDDGTLAVKVRIPFASGSNPALLDTVKMIAGSLGLSDISYVWIDTQGKETPVTRMASAPYLEIRGTAANMDAVKDGAITSIQYALKDDSKRYAQTFANGGLKVSAMPGYPSPEPTPTGGSSSGCDAGAFGVLALVALCGAYLWRKQS